MVKGLYAGAWAKENDIETTHGEGANLAEIDYRGSVSRTGNDKVAEYYEINRISRCSVEEWS